MPDVVLWYSDRELVFVRSHANDLYKYRELLRSLPYVCHTGADTGVPEVGAVTSLCSKARFAAPAISSQSVDGILYNWAREQVLL